MTSTPAPLSITHQHLAAVVASETDWLPSERAVRLLDAGCGDGNLLAFLDTALSAFAPQQSWELYGFDVTDSTTNREGFPATTVEGLRDRTSTGGWEYRLRACSIHEPWPFPDEHFEVIVSNQVLEHVQHLDRFLSELRRVLVPGGRSYHLFPLRSCLYEGHIFLPLAAQITGTEQRRRWVRVLHRIGLGRTDHRAKGHEGSRSAADYVQVSTHYRSWRQLVFGAKRHGLLASYRYTPRFYGQKLRQVTGRPLQYRYPAPRHPAMAAVSFNLFKYVSSVHIVLERPPVTRPTGAATP